MTRITRLSLTLRKVPQLPSSARNHRGLRLLAAGVGTSLVAAPLTILLTAPAAHAAPVEIQILATNDFHGRIANNPTGAEAGAATMAGAVDQLRGENPNTVFAAAGDLIGASTFESFIANDKPTIDALNEAGLEVSSVGNHEFDQGYDDLVNRVMAPFDATTNPDGGAGWQYLAANVDEPGTNDFIPDTFTKDFGDVRVGFVGGVTEQLLTLVSPGGMEGVTVSSIVDATNTAADDLVADGADVVVLLVHEGADTTDCASPLFTDPTSTFGSIVDGVNANVDAIVSGHTHRAYNCTFDGRPVVSAGQYGTNLNQLIFTVEDTTGEVTGIEQNILALKTNPTTPNYPADTATQEIVDDAVAEADVLGAAPLGEIDGAFNRARKADPTVENRGGESTLGNLVAEVQRWATEDDTFGGAEIAFMNPGGLRADMVGTVDDGYPETLTYKQAALVQPFANTLINMQLTGAKIQEVLEQQWQTNPGGPVPTRPFLRLGVSKGFKYTYEPPPLGSPTGTLGEITGMWLNGDPIEPTETFSVTVNSFLATGGDNFRAFADGTDKRDTGKVDLQAMVDYMAEFAGSDAVEPDYAQQAVGVTFPDAAPATYAVGDEVAFDLSSLAMTGPGDVQDDEVSIRFNGQEIGTAPVDNTVTTGVEGNQDYDEAGVAEVAVTLPRYAGDPNQLAVVGTESGTRVAVPIDTVPTAKAAADMTVTSAPAKIVVDKTEARIKVKVRSAGDPATGKVTVKAGGRTYNARLDDTGRAVIELRPFGSTGNKTVRVSYDGDSLTRAANDSLTLKVVKK